MKRVNNKRKTDIMYEFLDSDSTYPNRAYYKPYETTVTAMSEFSFCKDIDKK